MDLDAWKDSRVELSLENGESIMESSIKEIEAEFLQLTQSKNFQDIG